MVITWIDTMSGPPSPGSRRESFGLVCVLDLPPPPEEWQISLLYISKFEAIKKQKLRILERYLEKTTGAVGPPGESKVHDPLPTSTALTGNLCWSNCNRDLWILG